MAEEAEDRHARLRGYTLRDGRVRKLYAKDEEPQFEAALVLHLRERLGERQVILNGSEVWVVGSAGQVRRAGYMVRSFRAGWKARAKVREQGRQGG